MPSIPREFLAAETFLIKRICKGDVSYERQVMRAEGYRSESARSKVTNSAFAACANAARKSSVHNLWLVSSRFENAIHKASRPCGSRRKLILGSVIKASKSSQAARRVKASPPATAGFVTIRRKPI